MISNITGGLTGLAVLFVAWAVFPEQPFMEVHRMDVSGDDVIVDRTIRGPDVVADWRVTVVSDTIEAPTCQTRPGENLHEGWSPYRASSEEQIMPIDLWVGDPGCAARLIPGEYDMFVTWTPRDNRSPVAAKTHFIKTE